MGFPINGVLVITPPNLRGSMLSVQLEELLRGGAVAVLYAPGDGVDLGDARVIRALSKGYGAPFIVNEDIESAIQLDADGVHLGQRTFDIDMARSRLGNEAIIGISIDEPSSSAPQKIDPGADYLLMGITPTQDRTPVTVETQIGLLEPITHLYSGTIAVMACQTPDDTLRLIENGASLIAVSTDIFMSSDPRDQTRALADLFKN